MRRREILIGDRAIGAGSSVFVIAEIGINHGGSLVEAIKLIDAAVECGADAVKFQTFRADRLLVEACDRVSPQEDTSESAYQMFRRLELGREEHWKLKKHAENRGIMFLSTPFDEESADLLDEVGVPAFKIASADLSHLPLLRHIAAKQKPVLLSTGMSFLSEVADAVWTLRSAGAEEIVLLHCLSCCPAVAESANLRAIQTLGEYFNMPVGYSDHTPGILMPVVAVALGASLVEKHFTLDRNGRGPDHQLSSDPAEFKNLVQSIRAVEASLGDGRKCPASAETEGRLRARRSIVAAVDIRAHETIAAWMLALKRPGTGMEPRQLDRVIGMKARRNIVRDAILQWDDLTPSLESEQGEEGGITAMSRIGGSDSRP